jgi:multiple antibiotic resistance protein
LAFFALTGHLLFSIFNITVAAFKIAGGVLLVDVALKMLNPRKGEYSNKELDDVAIVPLAFPFTAGPGTIATVMLLVSEAKSYFNTSLVSVGIFAGIVLSYAGMYTAQGFLNCWARKGFA